LSKKAIALSCPEGFAIGLTIIIDSYKKIGRFKKAAAKQGINEKNWKKVSQLTPAV
jgi:hypothetical protein